MPFQPTMFFAIGFVESAVPEDLAHLMGVQGNTITVTFNGYAGTEPNGAIAVLNEMANIGDEPFVLTGGNRAGSTVTAQLTFSWAAYNALSPSDRVILLGGFVAGGRRTLAVTIGSQAGNNLPIELRILKTTEFLVNVAGTTATAAHSGSTVSPNLVLPVGDAAANYAFSTPNGELGAASLGTDANALSIGAASAPALTANRLLRVTATNVPSANGLGVATNVSTTSDLTLDIHLPTEVVLEIDRSGSMNRATSGGGTKWDAAKAAANLFSAMFGGSIPNLGGPNGSVLGAKGITLGRFTFSGGGTVVDYTPAAGFTAAGGVMPSIPMAETAGGGTPIGDALTSAQGKFTGAGWRRRHIVLLTDGMHNSGTTALTVPATGVASDVKIHVISYALVGETAIPTLSALAGAHGGLLLGSESNDDELDPEKLRDMFLDILGTILPVNRQGSLNTPPATLVVEDGVDRAIFIAPGAALAVSRDGVGQGVVVATAHGLTFGSVDNPAASPNWTTVPLGVLLLDLSLLMNSSVEPQGVGRPVKVHATLEYLGQPVGGATVVAKVRRPGESAGEALVNFAKSGALLGLVGQKYFTPLAVDVKRGVGVPASIAALGFNVQGQNDTLSLRRALLDAAEAARGAKLSKANDDVVLHEVSPGHYEGQLGASFTQEDGLYSFELHAEGTTPRGAKFARDQTRCTSLDPLADVLTSVATLTLLPLTDKRIQYTATVFPRTATGRAIGPGLGNLYVFHFSEPKAREAWGTPVTVDLLDGRYAAEFVLPEGATPPQLSFVPVGFGPEHARGTVVVGPEHLAPRYVRVTLERVRIKDDKDGWLTGKGEIVFHSVVSPGDNPARAVRRRIPESGHFHIESGHVIQAKVVIFEGYVEPGKQLDVGFGGSEFDTFFLFQREERFARYHRTLTLRSGLTLYSPGDELNDPERLADWDVWYTVEVF